PRSVVIAGVEAAVEEVASTLREQGRRTTRLRVSHAFHSPLMEPMLDAFREVAERIAYAPPVIPVVSNLSGQLATGDELASSGYWVRHVRDTVRFADGITALNAHGVTRFLEIGPDGTLTALTRNCTPDDSPALLTPTLRKDSPEHPAVLRAMALLHVNGAVVDWATALPPAAADAPPVDLPTYAFQRTRFWPTVAARTVAPAAGSAAEGDASFWSMLERRGAEEVAETLGVDEDALGSVLPALSDLRRDHVDRAAVNGWRYRVEWEPLELPIQRALPGRWLLLQGPGAAAPVPGLERFVPGLERLTCDVLGREALARALEQAFDGGAPAGVISCLNLPASHTGEAASVAEPHSGVIGTMTLVQALGDIGASAPVWVFTQAGFGPDRVPGDPAQAAVWGFGRVAALEHPERWGGLVDLSPQPGHDELAAVVALLAHGDEDQVAVAGAAVHARRLRPASLPASTTAPPLGGDDSSVPRRLLVTGGTGALGVRVAEWFAGRGTREVVLASRGGADVDGAAGTVARVEAAGAERVEVVSCDVADRAQVAALLDAHQVDGIAHVAGVLDVEPIDTTTPAQVEWAMAAKAQGTLHLEELTRNRDLSVFVVFSSIAGVWGSGGQAAYAAANAVADAVVEARRARGAVGVSVAWGPWAGGGMVSDVGAEELERRGLRTMEPRRALLGLESALAGSDGTVVMADVEWDRFVPAFTSRRPAPFLTGLPGAARVSDGTDTVGAEPGSAAGRPALVEQVATLSPQGRAEALLGHVRRAAARALGHADIGGVGADRAFRDMGFDSLTAVELRNTLIKDTGLPLPTTLVFDHPSPAALAQHLDAELSGGGGTVTTMLADLESSVVRIMRAGLDQDVRTLLGARLKALLGEIEEDGGDGDEDGTGAADGGPSLGDRLEGASDEELFDLISRELEQ
ncbi:SDR family NAD(P)-dependent oxidoreductase, partial [Streptomyces sp. bgisy153]|uniref:SDR family NAD(P)-dependent oxidoreductase n=1 Tax=Streptomyces sp. bgisy153 TaxID=3413793 RepID=UPI003D73EA48